MKKKDLNNNHALRLRNGDIYVVARQSTDCDDVIMQPRSGRWMEFSDFNENLQYIGNKDRDVVEVYRTIWERKEVKELTMKEVEKKFGCKVKIIK